MTPWNLLEGPTVRRLLALTVALPLCLMAVRAADGDDDTPKAKKTRELLKKKITVNFKDTRLEDVVDELKEQIKDLHVRLDSKGGVSRNQTITYAGKDVTLAEALDKMFMKNGLGYIVISQKNNAYDGSIFIKQGKERGYPLKDEPKDKDKKDKKDK
jgi:hypothetical protein